MKLLAVIPARGGSKRIKRKNIKSFHGKPIIAYTLETLNHSGIADKVHVSTEDEEIYNVVAECGFKPDFFRPSELAEDDTPTLPVLRHSLEMFADESYDAVLLINPCSVLVESRDLVDAYQNFKKTRPKVLMAVARFPAPVEWAFDMREDGRIKPRQPNMLEKRSQEFSEAVYDTGTFAFLSSDYVLSESGAGSFTGMSAFEIDRRKAVDIDTLDDWNYAEFLYTATQKGTNSLGQVNGNSVS